MKTILFILLSTTIAMAQDLVKINGRMHPDTLIFKKYNTYKNMDTTSKYKAGFVYYTPGGTKVTLLRWQKNDYYPEANGLYNWKVLIEKNGESGIGYNTDIEIDRRLGKAFLWNMEYYVLITETTQDLPKREQHEQ